MQNDALTTDPPLDAEAWPATQPGLYRSEAFAEDLEPVRPPEPAAPPYARKASHDRASRLRMAFGFRPT